MPGVRPAGPRGPSWVGPLPHDPPPRRAPLVRPEADTPGDEGKPRLAIQYACSRCSFVFQVEGSWTLTGAPGAPVHPVHRETGKVTWRMCSGSAQRAVGQPETGPSAAQT
jgi:hypothetical protein